ncbi:MAG: hypothetical protein JWM53_2101 [bacterium]|nr:hypothetical protein [bacterium]
MRTLFALASLTLLVATGVGCGDDTTTAVADMTVGADLSATPHDMATLTCAQIITCESNCTTSSCQVGCFSAGSTAAQATFGQFLGCLAQTCGPTDGGGNGSCTGVTDTSAGCQTCLKNAGMNAALGGPCNSQFMACTSS